jgi:biopolymer transport protein ExbD
MRIRLLILLLSASFSCDRNPKLDGLWIDHTDLLLIKFEKDSALLNSLNHPFFNQKVRIIQTKDSLITEGLNPILNDGKTRASAFYRVTNDTLIVGHHTKYLKSKYETYSDHFLSPQDNKIILPNAYNGRPTERKYSTLDIKLAEKDELPVMFINDIEIKFYDFDSLIKEFKREEPYNQVAARLFIDQSIKSEVTFWIINHLRSNDIFTIHFMTENDNYDPYTNDFYGLQTFFQKTTLNIIEEKNVR